MTVDFAFYLLLLLIIFLMGISKFMHLRYSFKLLTFIIFIILLSEISSRILIYTIKNSNPTYHILCIVQYIGFALIYKNIAINQKISAAIKHTIIPFVALSMINTIFFQKFLTFPSNIVILSYLMFIVFSLTCFVEMLDFPIKTNIFKQSIFHFNCAMLFYSATSPVCFGILSYLIHHELSTVNIRIFIYVISLIYYSTLGYAIFLDQKNNKLNIRP